MLTLTSRAFAAQSVNSQGEAAQLLAQQLYCNVYNTLSGDLGIILGLLIGFAGLLVMIFKQMAYSGFVMILGGVCITALPAFMENTFTHMTQMASDAGMENQVFDIENVGFSASHDPVDCKMFDVQLEFIQQMVVTGGAGGDLLGGASGDDVLGTGFGTGSGQCVERNGTVGGSVVAGGGYVTSCYGLRSCTGCSHNHGGVDIGGGGPILAYADGTVIRSGYSSSYGWVVYIDHGNGMETRYAHMQPGLTVTQGQTVSAGTQLGMMGTTGNSSGVHLHFEVRQNDSTVDPCSVTNVCG